MAGVVILVVVTGVVEGVIGLGVVVIGIGEVVAGVVVLGSFGSKLTLQLSVSQ